MLEAAPRRFVSGETLPYLGRNVLMIVKPKDVPSPHVRFDHWRFRISAPNALSGDKRYEAIRRAVVVGKRLFTVGDNGVGVADLQTLARTGWVPLPVFAGEGPVIAPPFDSIG